jgi:hypothetical protein
MRCGVVRKRLSVFIDGELPPHEMAAVTRHLAGCRACARHLASLRWAIGVLAEAPRLEAGESLAARVVDRLEVETRGPGLALLFESWWVRRPLIVPSLIPATCLLVAVLSGALALDRAPVAAPEAAARSAGQARLAASGTEANPLFPSAEVSTPKVMLRASLRDEVLEELGDHVVFLETVVARDGSVSQVTLLEGDSAGARAIAAALREERFEPGRYRGRPVAVSLYRLFSRTVVLAS